AAWGGGSGASGHGLGPFLAGCGASARGAAQRMLYHRGGRKARRPRRSSGPTGQGSSPAPPGSSLPCALPGRCFPCPPAWPGGPGPPGVPGVGRIVAAGALGDRAGLGGRRDVVGRLAFLVRHNALLGGTVIRASRLSVQLTCPTSPRPPAPPGPAATAAAARR